VARLTKHIIETYQLCNPEFKYSEELNPKRFLTSPADGVLNDGHDNANSDLILSVNYVLVNSQTQRRSGFVYFFCAAFVWDDSSFFFWGGGHVCLSKITLMSPPSHGYSR